MRLHLASILLGGFAATVVMTTILTASQRLRRTRMSLPLMLGAMVSGSQDRARLYGFLLHFAVSWLSALVYGLLFESLGRAGWLAGTAMGLVHGLFLLVVIIPLLPSVHPRMAGEYQQPQPTALLEPPGFMALNYGVQTPLVTLAAYLVYGAVIGMLYDLT